MCGRTAGRTLGACALSLTALIAVLWLPAAGGAQAPSPLLNTMPPKVVGSASMGHILTGTPGVWTGEAPLELGYQWRRCEIAGPCTDIPGASTPSYSVGQADIGMRIQFRVIASSGGTTQVLDSEPTETVPGERVRAAPAPRETAATPSQPASSPARAPVRARLIAPFPVVRITGWYTARWTVFSRVTVRAPAGVLVAIRCTGRGCPFRHRRRTVSGGRALVRIAALERRLRPGVRLVVVVTEPGRIGKYTRIRVRRSRAPARRDACVMPGGAQPVACRSA